MGKLSAKKHVAIYVTSIALFIVPPVLLTAVLMALDAMYGMKPSQGVAVLTSAVYVLCTLQFLAVQVVYYFWLLVKMWGPLQDGVTPVTVGKAVGFSFIPVFRVYWWFVAWGGYPDAYNKFAARRQLALPSLKSSIFTIFPLTILAADFLVLPLLLVPFVMVGCIVAVCRANNALAQAMGATR